MRELGSGISLGHPIGATDTRQMVAGIYHQMQRKNYTTGLTSMYIARRYGDGRSRNKGMTLYFLRVFKCLAIMVADERRNHTF